jgi:hypothetical protein
MRKTVASVVLSLALMSSAAIANDRAGDPVSGAISKIGHAARTLVGHITAPFTARSRSSSRSSAPTGQAQRVTGAERRSHVADIPSAPRIIQTDAPTAAPAPRSTSSDLPPVQPLE